MQKNTLLLDIFGQIPPWVRSKWRLMSNVHAWAVRILYWSISPPFLHGLYRIFFHVFSAKIWNKLRSKISIIYWGLFWNTFTGLHFIWKFLKSLTDSNTVTGFSINASWIHGSSQAISEPETSNLNKLTLTSFQEDFLQESSFVKFGTQ